MKETNFKHTDIGDIPHDWNVVKLGEIGVFSKGRGISRDVANTGEIPAVRYGELYTIHNNYIKEYGSFISKEVAKNAHQLKKGDILFTCSGETKEDIGKSVAFIDSVEAYAGGDLIILSPYNNYSPLFLGFTTNSKGCQEQKAARGQGDAVVHISAESISSILIPFPPTIAEQQRIATALSQMDELISALDEQINKKLLIKQAAMQQLLTAKTRLNGFSEPWHTAKLGEILDYEQPTDYLVASAEYSEKGTPVLTAGKTFILGYTQEKWGIYKNTPVILFDDFVAESKYVDFPFKVKSSAAKMLKLHDTQNNLRFIYELMQQIDFPVVDHKRRWISEYSQLEISIPSLPEQQAIASILTAMDNEIQTLQTQRDKYTLIKQGMMQQLLTGKIRI